MANRQVPAWGCISWQHAARRERKSSTFSARHVHMGRLNYSDCCVIDLRMPVRESKHQSRQDAGRRGAKSVTCLEC